MPHAKLTPQFVKTAKPAEGAERTVYWDAGLEGFGLVVTAGGHRSWCVQYRAKGVSRRYTISGRLTLAKARKKARTVQGAVAGRDPVREERRKKAEPDSRLKAIAEECLRREEKKGELRSLGERRRIFERYLDPKIESRQIAEIKRSDITRLLDKIEDNNGPVMADHVLAMLRKLMNWHAGRGDDFRSPIVRGMARTKPAERARERTLEDSELVFTTDGKRAFSGFSKTKAAFDTAVLAELRKADPNAKPLPRWTNHDLRRTAHVARRRAAQPGGDAGIGAMRSLRSPIAPYRYTPFMPPAG